MVPLRDQGAITSGNRRCPSVRLWALHPRYLDPQASLPSGEKHCWHNASWKAAYAATAIIPGCVAADSAEIRRS